MKLLSLEPESSASANSAMPASSVRLSLSPQRSIIIAQWDGDVNTFSKSFLSFFRFFCAVAAGYNRQHIVGKRTERFGRSVLAIRGITDSADFERVYYKNLSGGA